MTQPIALNAFPMHGQKKLSREGYRTRDGHMIEWFGRKLAPERSVAVYSRPEPAALAVANRFRGGHVAAGTTPVDSLSLRIPSLNNRRRWWVDSANSFRAVNDAPTVTWNPFVARSNVWQTIVASGVPIVADLLDDWSIHYAFEPIREEVNAAYASLFSRASAVFANAEGTLELAHRFGRSDAVLLTNGCDPDRFSSLSRASGPLTVGYVGKIGRRLDLDLILDSVQRNPAAQFVFAGPILDREYRKPLADQPNVELVGDVHYGQVPTLLERFDVGWVPHRVGRGEVGGDVIKTYEYRAAGLPVLTTPVVGANNRGLDAVHVLAGTDHAGWIAEAIADGPRVERVVSALPADVTWESKASAVLSALGLEARSESGRHE